VGQAGKVAEVLMRKAERLRTNPDQPLKLLVSGAPGIGKTSLVNLIARTLASHPVAIEDVNGKEVGLELAREWTRSLAYGSLSSDRGRSKWSMNSTAARRTRRTCCSPTSTG
jgi:adenylylsulfate kinase-like enzyme